MINITDSTKLQSEYFPTILWKLPISPNLTFFLFAIIVIERSFGKSRGQNFHTNIEYIAQKHGISQRTAKDYLQQLKKLNLIEQETICRYSYYRINWSRIGQYGNDDDLYISEQNKNETMNEDLTQVEVMQPEVQIEPAAPVVENSPIEVEQVDESDVLYNNVIQVIQPHLVRWRAMNGQRIYAMRRIQEIQNVVTGICQTHQYNLSQRKEVVRIINSLAA